MSLDAKRAMQHNFKRIVVKEESTDKVGFIPGSSLFQPGFRVIEIRENIVNVNPDAGLEFGKNFKKQKIDVAPGLADVAGINEKNVVRFQGGENFHVSVLHRPFNDLTTLEVVRMQQAAQAVGIRLNESELGVAVVLQLNRVQHHGGGESRTHFDDSARLQMPDNQVQKNGVGV